MRPISFQIVVAATAVLLSLLDLPPVGGQQIRSQPSAASLLAQGRAAEARGDARTALRDFKTALRLDPANAQVSFSIGQLLGETGNMAESAQWFRRALKIKPDFPEAHYNLGLALMAGTGGSPDWTDAITQFRAVTALQPNNAAALEKTALCFLGSGHFNSAAHALRSVLQLRPNSAQAHFEMGQALQSLGKTSQAGSEYLLAIHNRPSFPAAQAALGNLLLHQGDIAAASEHFHLALRQNPELEAAHYGLARTLQASGNNREAKLEFREASSLLQRQSDEIQSSHLSNQSLQEAKKGSFATALQLAQRAISLNPQNVVADYNYGLLLADSGDLPAAARQLRNAISLSPLQSRFYAVLSRMQQKEGDYGQAAASLRIAVQLQPGDMALLRRLKLLEATKPRVPEAKDQGDSSFPFGAPSNTAADHFAFAQTLAREGDLEGAVGEMSRALELQPERPDIRYALALVYTRLGEFDRAELALQKALLQSPDFTGAHIALGALFLHQSDKAGAFAEFKDALRLDPRNSEALQMLARCKCSR